MGLFKLSLATLLQRKVWLVVLLALIGLPIVLPYITPHESDPTLIEPARAQVAWVLLWFLATVWGLFQAANLGDQTVKMNLGAYFYSRGVSGLRQMLQIWAACMLLVLPMVAVVVTVCLVGAMPSSGVDASQWVLLNIQYATLFLLVMAPMVMLAVSLGSRFGSTIGYIIPLSLVAYGAYGVGYVDMLAESKNVALMDWIYVLSPQVHLADLTPRLVFKKGNIPWEIFFQIVAYFVGLKLFISSVSYAGFRVKPAS